MNHKVCSGCNTSKPVEEFPPSSLYGLESRCRGCRREYHRTYSQRRRGATFIKVPASDTVLGALKAIGNTRGITAAEVATKVLRAFVEKNGPPPALAGILAQTQKTPSQARAAKRRRVEREAYWASRQQAWEAQLARERASGGEAQAHTLAMVEKARKEAKQ